MFTGIIEFEGVIADVWESGENRTFLIKSALTKELKVDQSLAHNGICLTIEAITGETYQVTAVAETLKKTNAGKWQVGNRLNLERAMLFNGRLDGHLVQGHIDTVGICNKLEETGGSWVMEFRFPEEFAHLIIEKGSIAVNGISLTAWNVTANSFSVAVIPYTYSHTNLRDLKTEDTVNLEFDMVGKYISRISQCIK